MSLFKGEPGKRRERGAEPTLLVFATGGTIGMHDTSRGLAPDPGFPEALEHFVAAICEPLGSRYRINHLNPPIDSANADTDTAPRIARTVGARVRTVNLGSDGSSGVVILHGTDTLAYTAARLAFELADLGAPVVVTGSQFPLGSEGSDAIANLSLAIRAALKARSDAPVSIAFGGKLLPAVRATKCQTEALEAFRAERPLVPGAIGTGKVTGSGTSSHPQTTQARIITFKFVPGVTAADLHAAVGADPDGLVLECYGSGNGPLARPGMAEVLRTICERMPVVAVTQCVTGGVDFSRYAVASGFVDAGVIDGGDLTVEAALAKLAFALDRGAGGEPLREIMGCNLVGEQAATDA